MILTAVSRASLLAIVALQLFLDAWLGTGFRLDNPLRLLRAFAGVCVAPAIAAWLLARLCRATVRVERGALVLEGLGRRTEIPLDVIDRVAPTAVPVLCGGLFLRLASGRRFPYDVLVADPVAFIKALVDAGAPDHIRAVTREPAVVYLRSKRSALRRWDHPLLKFVVFGLVPTLPLFRLHQWIAYGGTFGEYYVYGLKAYLLAFAIYWGTSVVYLTLYAAVLRALVEPLVWGAAYVAPGRTCSVRRTAETVNRVLYCGGVPLFLLRLFLLAS